jgi:hypothetical protein
MVPSRSYAETESTISSKTAVAPIDEPGVIALSLGTLSCASSPRS